MMHDNTKKFIGGLLLLGSFWLKDWVYYVCKIYDSYGVSILGPISAVIIYLIVIVAGLLMIINPKSK